MDISSAVIVVVFVMTIFSSLGSNQGYAPPKNEPKPATVVSQPAASTHAEVPLGFVDEQTRPIANYIAGFRQPKQAKEIAESIVTHSKTYNVDPKLVAALMRRESGFNPRALSSSGAVGLGQLLPSTCKTTGVENPYDVDENTKGTVRYVRYLLEKFASFEDPVKFALAGYLEGPNGVYRNHGYKAATSQYVEDILGIYNKI